MAGIEFKIKPERRQAMLSIREPVYEDSLCGKVCVGQEEVARVPVFVWPMPTSEGLFVVEHQDGTVQRVQPDALTLLGSKELFGRHDWIEHEREESADTCENLGRAYDFECSVCGCEVSGGDELGHNSSKGPFKFCPNCGRPISNV